MIAARQLAAYDRVLQRWQPVALERHFREAEGPSIAQIAALMPLAGDSQVVLPRPNGR